MAYKITGTMVTGCECTGPLVSVQGRRDPEHRPTVLEA
jgi:hypothetical protein